MSCEIIRDRRRPSSGMPFGPGLWMNDSRVWDVGVWPTSELKVFRNTAIVYTPVHGEPL